MASIIPSGETIVGLVEGAVVIGQIENKDDRPTLRDLNRYVIKKYAADWKDIGLELGLQFNRLNSIEKDYHHSKDCFLETLVMWLKSTPNATWRSLEVTLTNVRRQQLSLDLVDDVYVSSDSSIHVTYKESCPFNECDFVSNVFGYNGGTLCIPEHAVTITIPHGAIEKELEVEVEAAASLYGPYLIPEGYSSISAFVWLGASYQFKEKVRIDVEHHAIACQEGILDLCLLTASADDIVYDEKNGQQLFKMHQDDCHYDYTLNGSTCSFFVQHFCSKCLASRRSLSTKNRMAIYHYLPKDYKSEAEFTAEVCFCYDLKCCRKTVEKQMEERRMSFQGSEITQISDIDNDEIHLLYPEELDGWSICHLWKDKITSKAIDFRELYKSHRELKDAESRNEFPPRFKLKLICYKPFITLNLKYKLCIKRKKESEELTLNIFVEGRKSVQQAALHSTIHQPHPTEEDGRNDVDVARTTSQINNLILVQGSTLSLTSPSILPSVDHSTFNSLQNFADDIYNTINIDLILPMMISNHLVSPGDAEYLSTTHLTTHEKQQKLGNIVLRLSEDCVKLFLGCLSITKHYEPHKMLLEKIHSVSNKPTSDDDIDSDYH